MIDYSNYTDEELITRIRDGEDGISEYLINKYKNLVMKSVKSLYILGGDTDDLIQEGMIGLFKAVSDYDAGRDASFFTFANICITRQIYTAIEGASRKKHIPLNQYISIYSENSEDDTSQSRDARLVSELEAGMSDTPEDNLLNKEISEEIENIIYQELSSLERQVFELHLAGRDYVEIAKILGRDSKSTDNALQRAKGKIRKAISHLLDK